jgi:plasmid stability protein
MPAKGATLTIRDVPQRVVRMLKRLAERQNKSMEQEVRDILAQHVAERASVLKQIEDSWASQACRPEPSEIEAWIASGRE